MKSNSKKYNSKTKIKDNKKENNKRSKSAVNRNKYKEKKGNKNIKYQDILNLFTNMKNEKNQINK